MIKSRNYRSIEVGNPADEIDRQGRNASSVKVDPTDSRTTQEIDVF